MATYFLAVLAYGVGLLVFLHSGWRANDLVWIFVATSTCFVLLQISMISVMGFLRMVPDIPLNWHGPRWMAWVGYPLYLFVFALLGFGFAFPLVGVLALLDKPLFELFPLAGMPVNERDRGGWDFAVRLAWVVERDWPLVVTAIVAQWRSWLRPWLPGQDLDLVVILAHGLATIVLEGMPANRMETVLFALVLVAAYFPVDALVAAWRRRHPGL